MFARITFQEDNKKLKYVGERFEYFHHYWTLCFSSKRKEQTESRKSQIYLTPNYLFLEKVKFESHRSLFIKINNQLNFNYENAKYKLDHLFTNHPYFSITENALIRNNQGLTEKVSNIIDILSNTYPSDFINNRLPKKQQIKDGFKALESQLLFRYLYEKRLSKQLHKTLSINKPLSSQDKEDIKFLVNALIVEFYNYGYDEDYISKIPNIITLRDNTEYFPYEKKLSDFAYDRDAYEKYAKEQNKDLDSKKLLNGLSKLLSVPKHKGYIIFKIEGIKVEESIHLLGVEFYNPQKERKVKERDHIPHDPELFLKDKSSSETSESKAIQPSTCNAIIEVSLLSSDKLDGFRLIKKAYRRVKSSCTVLENLLNQFTDTTFKRVSVNIQIQKRIMLYDSNRNPAFGMEIFGKVHNDPHDIQAISQQNKKWLELGVEFFNLANYDFDTGTKIIALLREHKQLENHSSSFSFGNLWIAWEAMFKGKPNEKIKQFKRVALHAVKIYLSNNFLPKTKQLLNRNLQNYLTVVEMHKSYYIMADEDLKRFGLEITEGEIIDARSFKKKYGNILHYLDLNFPILKEIIGTIDEFITNPLLYYEKANKWIENTIDEVYIERNLEVHNNEETDLSRFKLQGDFLEISRITMHEILRNINRNTKSDIQKVFERIKDKADRI